MAVVALGGVFHRFIEKSPISVMAGGLVERLLSPERLNEIFERTAIEQYTRELLFSTIFDLMSEVVMGSRRSVHAAYQASREEISVSIASVYNKLDGIETGVSAALVRETSREVAAVIEEMGGQIPALLPGYRVKILDGNAIAATEHRIRELRSRSAGPLPGKSLVVLDPQLRAVIDVFPLRRWSCAGAIASWRSAQASRASRRVDRGSKFLHALLPVRNCQSRGVLRACKIIKFTIGLSSFSGWASCVSVSSATVCNSSRDGMRDL